RSEPLPLRAWSWHAPRLSIASARSVGKPTLLQDQTKLLAVDLRAGRHAHDGAGQCDIVAGANHRRERFLPFRGIVDRPRRERAEPAPLGEAKRGGDRVGVGKLERRRAVGLADPGRPQRRAEPALAIATAAQCARLGERVTRIVDIAERGEALRSRLDVRRPRAVPAALADLAPEIGGKL